jgi:hypothetical protein
MKEQPPADFVDRIRSELRDTLALAQAADRLPWPDVTWPDLTRAFLAEKRFVSISNWLPHAEARDLRAALEAQLDRLYEAPDQP